MNLNTKPGFELLHTFRSRVLSLATISGFLFALTERGVYRKDKNGKRWRKIKAVGLESNG